MFESMQGLGVSRKEAIVYTITYYYYISYIFYSKIESHWKTVKWFQKSLKLRSLSHRSCALKLSLICFLWQGYIPDMFCHHLKKGVVCVECLHLFILVNFQYQKTKCTYTLMFTINIRRLNVHICSCSYEVQYLWNLVDFKWYIYIYTYYTYKDLYIVVPMLLATLDIQQTVESSQQIWARCFYPRKSTCGPATWQISGSFFSTQQVFVGSKLAWNKCGLPSLKLTARPWKWMVGICWNTSFLLGPGLFSGANWLLVSGSV